MTRDDMIILNLLFGVPMPVASGDVDRTTRHMCDAHEITHGTGYHKHHCASCQLTWKHDDMLPMVCNEAEFTEAHACPGCGADIRDKYF